jgi:hypothetical protein
MKSGRYIWGVTGAVLERKSFPLLVTYCLMMPMILLTGIDKAQRNMWQTCSQARGNTCGPSMTRS